MGEVKHYDLAIIGTGSGNTILDDRFGDRSVAILEHGLFGGTCLNVGCIPTKMFVYPADLARSAGHAPDLGVDTSFAGVRWPEIRDRIFGRIDPIPPAGRSYRQGLPNVTVYDGTCRFTGVRRLDTGTGETITADEVVIAAGGRVHLPDIPGLDDVGYHTSDTIMRLEELPARMAIIGGGFIAAEFAHVFSAYGVEVTQVHRGSTLLAHHDADIARRFTQIAQRQWQVRLDTQATKVTPSGEGIRLDLTDGTGLEVDVVLLATGRTSNADLLELEATGLQIGPDGIIEVDEFQRTGVPGIWALGDVANTWQLKHVANHEARVIQHNLLHPDELVAADHRFVPSAVFTSPQIASVGLTEEQAVAEGRRHVTAIQDYGDVAYGWAMEDSDHFVKLVADPATGHLLGAHIIGPQASLLLQPLIQGMSLGQRIPDLARGQYWIHPALTEVVENALLAIVLDR